MKKQKLIPLNTYIDKQCGGSMAEAARMLDADYMQLWRWVKGDTKAGRSSRKLAALRGVALP